MVCLSGRELRNTTPNCLIMFVINQNISSFKKPSNLICIEEMPPESEREARARLDAERIEQQRIQDSMYSFESFDALHQGADGLAGNSLEARSKDSVTNFGMVEDDINFPCDEGDLACYESYRWHDWYDKVNSNMSKDGMTYSEENPQEITFPEYSECQCGFDPDCGLAPWQNSGSQSKITTPSETELANII